MNFMQDFLMPAQERRQTILVIDDDPASVTLIDGALKHQYNIRVALDGERGLNMIDACDMPDLILLDVVMPRMDGYEVCEGIRMNPATHHVPIIFLTSLNDEFSTVRAFELGANDFVAKPICPRVLGVRVNAHLTLKNHHRELEQKVSERTQQIRDLQLNIIQCLGRASEFRDNETGYHVIRMSNYAATLARAAGLGDDFAEMMLHAAPMHDVGKIGIPDHILLKTDTLTEEEMAVIRKHPVFGAEILGRYDSELMHMARTVALTHHEKWDGSGYPYGLKGEDIPIAGRIVAIADVFDALTSVRPYKQAWTTEKALAYLKAERGRHFEPRLIDHFVEMMPAINEIQRHYCETF